ncbi:heterokaryon incompatibility protein [Rutstroemia sp. NJR-2017a BVV2]|nr:heterokaryon incompatibility protein [Rutstroemia sp. NJR-2017a BVV2]
MDLKGLVDYFKNEWKHDLLASETKTVSLWPTVIGTPSFTERNTSTGSNESLAQAAEWITKCVQQHMECKSVVDTSPKIFPARLVYISPCEDGPLRLCETSGLVPDTPYMTLSHCWGRKSFLKLTSENYDELKVQIPFEKLTKTFQDAIAITRFNKIEYIWIDSLCIIQDSRQDWEKESSLMKDIYSNTFCNIAASHAADGEMGCFVDRTLSGGSVMINIPVTFKANNGFHPGIWEGRDTASFFPEVLNSPLQKRAWVFQEDVLPPRTLYFSSKQIHFTCDHVQVCELYPETWSLFKRRGWEHVRTILRSLIIRGSENKVDFPRTRTAISLWHEMLNIYTRCDLTRESDRLIAISGLARLLQPLIPGRYLAGHWEDNLIEQLLWKSRGAGSRSGTYLAPSWSWGSTTRPIWAPESNQTNDIRRTLMYYEENKNKVITQLAFIRDVEIITTNGDPMSQVTSGFLRMDGALNLIVLDGEYLNPTATENLLISEDVWREKLIGKYCFVPLIESGWPDPEYRYISSKGLLLRPTGKETGQYERVAFAYHSGKEGNIFSADRNRQKGELITEDLYEKYDEETGLYTFTII